MGSRENSEVREREYVQLESPSSHVSKTVEERLQEIDTVVLAAMTYHSKSVSIDRVRDVGEVLGEIPLGIHATTMSLARLVRLGLVERRTSQRVALSERVAPIYDMSWHGRMEYAKQALIPYWT